jgi:hypothetical protein
VEDEKKREETARREIYSNSSSRTVESLAKWDALTLIGLILTLSWAGNIGVGMEEGGSAAGGLDQYSTREGR